MKKTYITPEALTVVLGTCKMMAESVPVDDEHPVNPGEFETKENAGGKNNIWSEEW